MQYDVVKEYDWTSVPRGTEVRKTAPRVWVKSYKVNANQLQQTLLNYLNLAEGLNKGAKEFYDGMYGNSASPEDDFNFPFFGDDVRSFSNAFSESFQDGSGGTGGAFASLKNKFDDYIGNMANIGNMTNNIDYGKVGNQLLQEDLAGAAKTALQGSGNAPGTYIEKPQFYQYDKTDSALPVSFVLSNTINSDWQKNADLVKILTKINRPLRTNSITVEPPRIYSVRVPGHRYIRWAYCESFSVQLLGTRRIIDNVIVPEAYKINMSFQSLTLEHAGFIDDEQNLN
jgi:hypothetical protein